MKSLQHGRASLPGRFRGTTTSRRRGEQPRRVEALAESGSLGAVESKRSQFGPVIVTTMQLPQDVFTQAGAADGVEVVDFADMGQTGAAGNIDAA